MSDQETESDINTTVCCKKSAIAEAILWTGANLESLIGLVGIKRVLNPGDGVIKVFNRQWAQWTVLAPYMWVVKEDDDIFVLSGLDFQQDYKMLSSYKIDM